MSERTKLLKKAVMTGVGATTNGDRIKSALQEAMQDLVKIGQELIEELEDRGKLKAKNAQDFIETLKDEAKNRSGQFEKQVSGKVQTSMQRAARDFGLATTQEVEELRERIEELEAALEDASGKPAPKSAPNKGRSTRGRKKSS